jgi:hypothetical protein
MDGLMEEEGLFSSQTDVRLTRNPKQKKQTSSIVHPQSVAVHRDLALHYHPEIQDYVSNISKERKASSSSFEHAWRRG